MPGFVIHPDDNIADIKPYSVITAICRNLDENGKWRQLIEVVSEKRFQLRRRDVENIAKVFYAPPATGQSPSLSLWEKYSNLGMKVSHMKKYLGKLKWEKELILLQKQSEPLIITKPPKSIYTTDCHKPLQIRCEAKGFPYPRYTWFKVAEGAKEVEEVDQNTTGVLEVKRKRDAGQYTCRIHNSLALEKRTRSDKHVLFTEWFTVQIDGEDEDSDDSVEETNIMQSAVNWKGISLKIRRQTMQTNHIVNMKDKLYLECKAEGAAPLSYQWVKDGMIMKDQTDSKILIERCWPTHSGIYWCTVRSADHAEITSLKHSVKILDPQVHPLDQVLMIKRFPQPLIKVMEGGQAMFSCEASTRQGVLVFKWFQTTASGSVHQVPCASDMLLIQPVTRSKAGKYYCEVQAIDDKTREVIEMKRTTDCELEIMDEILPQLSSPTDKIALFIGGENYRANSKLAAVKFDIQAVQDQFQRMGFKVLSLLDLTLKEMHQAINLLCDFTEPGVYVLLYFVGHGFYLNGNHYLMPWDVQHGNKLEDCLCLEEAHAKVQHKEPTFLLMINDICREDGRDKDISVTSEVPTFKPKVNGNSLIIFAASRTEKSYEPVVHSGPIHEEKRGVFSRHFCQTLTEFKNRPVVELFYHLQDCFRKKYMETYGKKYPMHPVMEVNLSEYSRKLTDTIDYTGREMEAEKRNQKFSFITQLPTEKCFVEVAEPEISLLLEMSFEERFSNQFVIVLNLAKAVVHCDYDSGFTQHQSYLNFDISTGSSHAISKEVESGHSQTRFIFSDIQRLKGDLNLSLNIQYFISGKPRNPIKVNLMEKLSEAERNMLKRPLISSASVWSEQPIRSSIWSESPPMRIPEENAELHNSL